MVAAPALANGVPLLHAGDAYFVLYNFDLKYVLEARQQNQIVGSGSAHRVELGGIETLHQNGVVQKHRLPVLDAVQNIVEADHQPSLICTHVYGAAEVHFALVAHPSGVPAQEQQRHGALDLPLYDHGGDPADVAVNVFALDGHRPFFYFEKLY